MAVWDQRYQTGVLVGIGVFVGIGVLVGIGVGVGKGIGVFVDVGMGEGEGTIALWSNLWIGISKEKLKLKRPATASMMVTMKGVLFVFLGSIILGNQSEVNKLAKMGNTPRKKMAG